MMNTADGTIENTTCSNRSVKSKSLRHPRTTGPIEASAEHICKLRSGEAMPGNDLVEQLNYNCDAMQAKIGVGN